MIPDVTGTESEFSPSTTTLCWRLLRNAWIQRKVGLLTPYACSWISFEWFTLSNALEKSSRIRSVCLSSCIMLHFTGWNLILHFLARLHSWSMSFWSFDVSSVLSIWRQQTQSSANKRISDSVPTIMSFIYKENNSGPRTVPCGTPDKTDAHWDFAPLTTTFCCLLHRNESIHTKVFPLMPYS